MNKKLNLIDRNKELCEQWSIHFENEIRDEKVKVIHAIGDEYFETKASAIVSPANSFGIMDGGIDAVIIKKYGKWIQDEIQQKISTCCLGENPVGNSIAIGGPGVELSPCPFRWIISAPTMRQPEDISKTYNAYLAMRAILIQMKHSWISSANICGLGTGIGNMSAENCASQMKMAYEQVINWNGIYPEHRTLWRQHSKLKRGE